MGDSKLLGGIAGFLLVLLVGTLFGRVHGSSDDRDKAVGDRVACGLLAVPLISVAVHFAFPQAHLAWALAAPVPLLVYVVLLAGTDMQWEVSEKRFTRTLLWVSLTAYGLMALATVASHV